MKWKLPVLMLSTSLLWSTPALADPPRGPQETELNAMGALTVSEEEDGTYIRIQGTQEATFSVFKLDDPPRLFVDLSNSRLATGEEKQEVRNGVISRVGLIEFEDAFQTMARLIISFDKAAHYDVRTEGEAVVVFVDGEGRHVEDQSIAQNREMLRQREAELRAAQARQQELEARSHQQRASYEAATTRLNQTEAELERVRRELANMRQQRDAASGSARQELEESIARQDQRLKEAQEQVNARQAEVRAMRQTLAEVEAQREREAQRLADAQARAQRAEEERQKALELARQKGQESEEARQRAQRLASELDQTKDSLSALNAQNQEAQSRLSQKDREVQEAQARIDAQRRELERAQRRQAELEERLEEMRRAGSQNGEQFAQLQAESRNLRALERQREQALAAAQAQAQRSEQELNNARQEARQAERALAEMASLVQERDAEIAGLRASLEESKQAQRSGAAAQAVAVDPLAANSIQGVRLETSADGRSRIVVDLDRPGNFETANQDGRAVMIFNNVVLPQHLEKTLSADADGGAVRFLSSYSDEQGRVRMEADLRSDASEIIRQDGNSVVWEFAPTVAEKSGRLAQDQRPRRATGGESVTSNPPNYARVVADPTQVTTVPGMSRQRITIDLRSADIANVLRLISSESGVNIIAGSDVRGEVTMRLRSVPLDQAFLTILQALRLGFEIRGNVIRVAPQSVLESEQQARAEARARAQAQEPLEVFLLPINYASASELTGQVSGLLSPRGSVSVDNRTNTMIIKDLRGNLDSIRLLVETLDAQVPQVLIEARIVETNDNFTRQVGIQWGGDISFSQGGGNPTGLIFPNILGIAGGATDGQTPVAGGSDNPNFAVNLPAPAGTGAGGAIGLTMGSVGGAVNLNLRLSALEDAGHAKIISSPRILTLDNRQATISQGTSIPISVVSAAGVQTVFVDATLELTVTPHVTPDGNIRLSIQATKNEPDFQNTGARGDPTIIRNQAQTELLIKDGDTTVIGGIYSQNSGHSVSAIPFLHKIPILGALFRAQSETENRSELLIFITPRIVNRAEALGIMSAGTLEADLTVMD